MVGEDAPVKDVDADRRIGKLAHKRQSTKMVYVAVGDENVADRF